MNDYFPQDNGIGVRIGNGVKQVLQIIANRFIADNPPIPVKYYLRSSRNFHISEDYMDEIALHKKMPELVPEQYVYAWAKLSVPQAGPFNFRFSAFGPVSIWVNGVLSYRTNHTQERFADQISNISLNLKEGENSLFFQSVSTPLGCGFHIGSSSYKGRRIQFFSPDREHKGMSGFVYSKAFERPIERVPVIGEGEEETGIHWYPEVSWEQGEKQKTVAERLFNMEKDDHRKMVSASRFFCPFAGMVSLVGKSEGKGKLWIDGKETDSVEGEWKAEYLLSGGYHTLAYEGKTVTLHVQCEGSLLELESPVLLADGRKEPWLYAGPFTENQVLNMKDMMSFQKPFEIDGGASFWRADMPDMYLRPFNEGVLYGEWNYPLGVTLYGMIQCGRLLNNQAIQDYVEGHMKKCTDFYDYCIWDKAFYGAAPFHNQLTTIDSLDDCGSIASTLLEVMKDHVIPEGRKVGDMVADYMRNKQQRLPDGTFYRNHSYLPIMNETIWADDLYMSIPFLCRYYELSGDIFYLRDAVRQIKQIFGYLFMPDLVILSHIYDTHYHVQTKVPWGRGNGWVLFSLTELLAVMPDNDPEREEILEIFQTLCGGYLKLQGKEGMWHQVLTFPHSFQETSCTAMFIYGFARGVRYGWLKNRDDYAKAALLGWRALCKIAVDWKGNIYGVCRGSGYSFSKEYYANDLGWNVNDTHGTGIVMLAAIEVEKMKESQQEE